MLPEGRRHAPSRERLGGRETEREGGLEGGREGRAWGLGELERDRGKGGWGLEGDKEGKGVGGRQRGKGVGVVLDLLDRETWGRGGERACNSNSKT